MRRRTEALDAPPGQGAARWEIALLVAVVIAVAVTRFPTLDNKLLEAGHAQRQTQTAIQTVVFHESGIDLLRPEIPVLGYPWAIPLEFPLFQAIASVPMAWGVPADVANRSTALGCFVLTALLLWLLVRKVSDRRIAAVTVVVFAFTPFALLWSRASLIEYLATAGAVGWVLALTNWITGRRWRWIALAAVAGSVATTVKITTALPWLAVVVGVAWQHARAAGLERGWLLRRLYGALVGVVVPVAAGLVWIEHSDTVKEVSPAVSWLTSSRLSWWNFGTLAQRLDPSNIGAIFGRIGDFLAGPAGLVLILVAIAVARGRRATWIGFAMVPVLAVAVFFNLYVVHDYYLAAVSPALAALSALALVEVVDRLPNWRPPVVLAAVTVVWLGLMLVLSSGYWLQAYEAPRGAPPEAIEITQLTSPGDLVMVGGIAWDPRVLYYAHRRGLMLYEPFVTRQFAASLPDLDRYRALYLAGPLSHLAEWAAIRPWYAPVTEHTMLLGGSLADLGPVELAASPLDRESVLGDRPVVPISGFDAVLLTCDGVDSITIPGGPGSLWLEVTANGEARAVMRSGIVPVSSESRTLAWLPVGGSDRPADTLTCINAGAITIESAVMADLD